MRVIAVLCVLLMGAVAAQAAVTGKVNSIGYNSFIRPDCWVPLTIQTTSDENGPKTFNLQVVQTDLDGDQVLYSRPITVNPGVQEFWTRFMPDPVNDGLPAGGTPVASDLAKRLKIFLCDPANNRQLVQIATAGSLPQAAEYGSLEAHRGQKLVLVVGRSPNVNEYRLGSGVFGTMEDTLFVPMRAADLPPDVLAYQAADAVVWTDEDPERLAANQFRALRQYVRSGGRLVVIQNAEYQRMSRLDEFLPVHINDVASMPGVDPLRSLTQVISMTPGWIDPWQRINGPFNITRATPITDAVVDTWANWPDGTHTPYIARRLFGVGCVSWIAQDISDPSVKLISAGWPRLWERIMDWHNDDLVLPNLLTKDDLDKKANRYDPTYWKDIGQSFNQGTNLNKKTAAYISVAVLFFIGYWALAGPGMFFILAARKQTQWSWFGFGIIAVGATLLTVGVTRLLLRGTAEVKHQTLVRVSSDGSEPGFVQSRVGIYLPRDENADIALTSRDSAFPAAITPLITWPQYTQEAVAIRSTSKYVIPIEGEDQADTVQISVPFRSTLKKLQITWTGTPPGRITGKPTLSDGNTPITGMLSNNTGRDLKDVIMVFRLPTTDGAAVDECLALPSWKNGVTLDIEKEWKNARTKPVTLGDNRPGIALYGLDKPQRGPWEWAANWIFDEIRGGISGSYIDAGNFRRTFALASLFDRCKTMVNDSSANNRCEIVRHDVRNWDCSAAVAAGALVVLGQEADSSLPLPLTVDGEKPVGDGHTFFQCIVPMDQSQFSHPPSTQPGAN